MLSPPLTSPLTPSPHSLISPRTQAVCGFLLFVVTSLGHNGLIVYEADERPDYWKLQVCGWVGLRPPAACGVLVCVLHGR